MTFTDIHTHTKTPAQGTIYNCGCNYIANRRISVGIHPWNIGDGWRNDFAQITDIARANNVIAIGECLGTSHHAKAVDLGHPNVDNYHVGVYSPYFRQGILSVDGFLYVTASNAHKALLDQSALGRIFVGNKYFCCVFHFTVSSCKIYFIDYGYILP
jgi:hypothetical protein